MSGDYTKMTREELKDEGPLEQEIRKELGIPLDKKLTEVQKYWATIAWLED